MGVGHVGLAGAEAVEVLLEAAAGPARVAGEVERGLRPPARQLPGVGALRDDVAVAVEQDDLGLVEHGLDRHRAVCLARAVARPGLVPDNDDRRVARRELGRGGVVRRRRGRGRGAGADGGGQRDERRRQAGPHAPVVRHGAGPVRGRVAPALLGHAGAEADEQRVRRDPARDKRLAQPEPGRAVEDPRRHEREQRGQAGDVGGRVHPHQDQVVALGQDALVHARRALRGRQQVEAELAPLGGDAHGRAGGEPAQRVLRLGRADVVGLVHHDEHRPPVGAPPPQPVEERGAHDGALLRRAEAAEVGHQAPPVVPVQGLQQPRLLAGAGPDRTSRATPRLRMRAPSARASAEPVGERGDQIRGQPARLLVGDRRRAWPRTRPGRAPGRGRRPPPSGGRRGRRSAGAGPPARPRRA